jgi:hypothetical protein
MFFELTCKVTIADTYILRGVHQLEVKKSIHQLVDTAKVQLPLSVVMRNQDLLKRIRLADKIKTGDKIALEFGYNGINIKEFEGYIRRTNPKDVFELECEDELYLFRQVYYKISWKSVTLKVLLNYLLDGYERKYGVRLQLFNNIPDVTLSNFIINNANGIAILQVLKDQYGLNTFLTVVNGIKVLYCGLLYFLEKTTVKYVVNQNTVDVNDLLFDDAIDKQFKIKAVNFNRNGTKSTMEIGDKNGELRTFYYYDIHDLKQLAQLAQSEMEKLKTIGYKGSFETFLIPYSEPGMVADMLDPQFPDRKGNYYISTVTTTFSTGGGRRKPEIDIKISA